MTGQTCGRACNNAGWNRRGVHVSSPTNFRGRACEACPTACRNACARTETAGGRGPESSGVLNGGPDGLAPRTALSQRSEVRSAVTEVHIRRTETRSGRERPLARQGAAQGKAWSALVNMVLAIGIRARRRDEVERERARQRIRHQTRELAMRLIADGYTCEPARNGRSRTDLSPTLTLRF